MRPDTQHGQVAHIWGPVSHPSQRRHSRERLKTSPSPGQVSYATSGRHIPGRRGLHAQSTPQAPPLSLDDSSRRHGKPYRAATILGCTNHRGPFQDAEEGCFGLLRSKRHYYWPRPGHPARQPPPRPTSRSLQPHSDRPRWARHYVRSPAPIRSHLRPEHAPLRPRGGAVCLRTLLDRGWARCGGIVGHSLGELAALAVSGVLSQGHAEGRLPACRAHEGPMGP